MLADLASAILCGWLPIGGGLPWLAAPTRRADMPKLLTFAAFDVSQDCTFRSFVIVLAASVARTFARRLTPIPEILLSTLSGWRFSHGPDVFAAESIHVLLLFLSPSAVVCELLDIFQGQGSALETEFAAERIGGCPGAQDHDVTCGFVEGVGFRFLAQGEDAAEEAVKVFPFGLTCA